MTDARLERKQELLASLAVAPTDDRPRLLADRCGDDPDLRAEVEALLPYLGAPTPSPAGDLEAALEEKLTERFVGKTFGPYAIQRLLGRGGFSRVFLAARSFEGQARTYAVKVPLGGSFAEEVARYRLEIAVLSQLRHPNIAGLVDVVPGPDDQPLLVMDYVDAAQPITLAAAEARLSIRQRIELFLKVLSALGAAHERGVIHCDISAGNVVLRSDGEPVVIDFGIAKVSWERAGTVTVGPRPLTYEYASPEQYLGEPLSVRTDIYSAGVLLYELLAGLLPHDLDRRDTAACRRTVCETRAERASLRCLRATKSAALPPQDAARALRGDLDAILGKALEKEPERRYATASAFADDLRAHLELRPVAAKSPGTVERTWRWVRRHPGVSATATLAVVLSAGFGAFHVIRLGREQARAQKIAAAFRDVLRGFDPAAVSKNPVTVRDLLDQAAAKAADQLKDEPLVRGAVLETLGTTYSSLGDLDRAEKLLREAVALRKGGSPAERAESLVDLGATLQRRGQLKEAEPLLREALDLRIKDRGPDDKAVAECMTTLAIIRKGQGDTKETIALIERSLAILEKVAPGSDAILESRNELANLLIESTSDYQKAIALHAQNLVDLRKYYGESHPYVALALNNIARAETDAGRNADADRHFQEALALQQKIYGKPHPETALTLHNYGFLRLEEGRLEEAEKLTRDSLEMRRSVLPKGHPDIAVSLNNLGLIVKRRGHLDEAEACYRESLEITRAAVGDDSPEIPVTLMNLGGIYRDKGEFATAEPLLEDALARDRKVFLSPNVPLVRDMTSLAQVKVGLRKYSEAEALLKEATAALGKTGVARDHQAYADVGEVYVTVLLKTGRPAEAKTMADSAVAAFEGKPVIRAKFEKLRSLAAGQ
ncbi:MAG TPA: serine/threonine-protein kinase [Thermoanaerobaculia bacterium]|nr:serine/threonine-protein kinase [Thermoanaerobaculia bacterium]